MRIERNYFQVGGAAVKISGDTHTWFESGPVTDVLIVRNTFDNCLIGPWGRAIIDIDPEIQAIDPNGLCYHQNITIEGNCFISFQERMVYAFSVDGLMFRNNRVEKSFLFAPFIDSNCLIETICCRHVQMEDNKVSGFSVPLLMTAPSNV